MPETVRFFKEGAHARIAIDGYLGPERFHDFLRAIDGAKFIPSRKINLAPIDKVPAILRRLKDAGFNAEHGDSAIREALLGLPAEMWCDLKSGQERIEKIDDELFRTRGARLFPFQKTGVLWLTLRKTGLLADDPGCGKTLECIAALPANAPVLVVGPSAAKGVWVGEIERWRPQIPVRMLSGRDSFRWPRQGEMLVTNYDILRSPHGDGCDGFLPAPPPKPCTGCRDETIFRNGAALTLKNGHETACTGFQPPEPRERCSGCAPFLKECLPGTVLVSDEAQALKNGKAQRTLAFRALSKAVREKDGRVWLLSGTPMENDPIELWSVLQAADLAGEAFGTFKNFVSLFKGKPKTFGRAQQQAGYDWGEPDDEVTERLQRVQLRRRKEDVLPELPDLIWGDHVVEIDKKAFAACDAFVQREGGIDKVLEMIEKPKVTFETFSKLGTMLAIAKLTAALEIVKEHEDRGEPLLVFSMHREPIDILAKRKGWLAITGDVGTTPTRDAPMGKRQQIQDLFQAEGSRYKGIACMIQAAGVALTLHRAAHELFIDMSFNPKQNEQAAARAHRIGQKRTVYAKRLRANHPLDRRLQDVITRKMALFTGSIDAAAVTDDAPPCSPTDFEQQIREVQEEISLGRVVRRMAETPEDEQAQEDLHRLVFVRASADRIARQLAQESDAIGLSDAQWRLARKIAAEGREPTPRQEAVEKKVTEDAGRTEEDGARGALPLDEDGMVDVEGDPHLPTCARVEDRVGNGWGEACDCGSVPADQKRGDVDMAKVADGFEKIKTLTDAQRSLLFELMGEAYEPAVLEAVVPTYGTLAAFSENEEEALLKMVTKAFCTACGGALPKKGEPAHECPDEAENDEEDDEDGEDAEEEGEDSDG